MTKLNRAFLMAVVMVATLVAHVSAASACMAFFHQPELPSALRK
ncbi:MAG: cyclic lactone autoinducer peptide [bacterium]|jgi:cyclic lactone autoinducer peptide